MRLSPRSIGWPETAFPAVIVRAIGTPIVCAVATAVRDGAAGCVKRNEGMNSRGPDVPVRALPKPTNAPKAT